MSRNNTKLKLKLKLSNERLRKANSDCMKMVEKDYEMEDTLSGNAVEIENFKIMMRDFDKSTLKNALTENRINCQLADANKKSRRFKKKINNLIETLSCCKNKLSEQIKYSRGLKGIIEKQRKDLISFTNKASQANKKIIELQKERAELMDLNGFYDKLYNKFFDKWYNLAAMSFWKRVKFLFFGRV